jgi:catechol 2,3-dioxygenase-like lactoylglutathione lyase family enzyme
VADGERDVSCAAKAKPGERGMAEAVDEARRAFRVPMMYHPSHDVLDLDEAEQWYEGVFGSRSTSLESLMARLPPKPGSGYPPNYSTFTMIGDVLFDTIDPKRYVIAGVQRLPTVKEPHLRLISWYIDDMTEGYRALKRHGVRLTNQIDEIVDGDETPTAFGSDMQLFFTLPEDAGLRYSFSSPAAVAASDPRSAPGWTPRPAADNPLGVEVCSHHTILTDRPERGLKLHCDVLGGRVIHQGRNALLGATSTYVHLAGSTIEFATPDRGTAAYEDWEKRAPNDTYHAVTWTVADLARAESHLASQGVRIRSRSRDTLITDPATSLGIPWGFSTELPPGDPRRGPR